VALPKALADAFERFWAAYPRRPDNPKAAARLVFERRVREGADPAAIAAAAGRYAAAVTARRLDAIYVPHARTWLSQRRWEDYLEDAPASAPVTQPESKAPSPDHPLAWLAAEIGDDVWGSWIGRLAFDPATHTITAETSVARDKVRSLWGRQIAHHYGQDIAWEVQKRDAA
jgi:hypothetical protein